MIKQLQRVETLLEKFKIKTESLHVCEQYGIDVLHIEKRGKSSFHYISNDDFHHLADILTDEAKSREEKRKQSLVAAGHHQKSQQNQFVPTRAMIDRLDRIEAKLDMLLDDLGVKRPAAAVDAEHSLAPLNGRNE